MLSQPRKIIAKIVAEIDAEILLDKDGNIEEIIDVREVLEGIEIVSVTSVLTTQ